MSLEFVADGPRLEEPPAKGFGMGNLTSLLQVPTAVPVAGRPNDYGVPIDEDLGRAYAAFHRGEVEAALDILNARQRKSGGNDRTDWVAESLRFDTLLRLERAADAEQLTQRLAALERQLANTAIDALAMRGLARMILTDYEAALADLGRVAKTIGAWSLPVSYGGPPSNVFELQLYAAAQMRTYSAIAAIHARRSNYAAAARWAEAAEQLFRDFYFVMSHPTYGPGHVAAEAAYGRAFNLAILGFSHAMVRPEETRGDDELAIALRFFEAERHVQGQAVVLALRTLMAVGSGRIDEALSLSLRGESFAAEAGLGDTVWQFSFARGEAEWRLGRKDRAEAAFRSAQNGLDVAIGALASESAKLRLGAGKEALTRWLVILDLEKQDHAALFRDLERGRARAFVDLLRDIPLAQGRQTERIERIRRLDRDIRLQRLRNGAPGAPPDGKSREHTLLHQREREVMELRAVDPELADTLSVATVELKEVQARLAPGEVLAYALPDSGDERLSMLLVEKSASRVFRCNISERELAELIEQLSRAVENQDVTMQKELVGRISSGLRLIQWGATAALYVVPHGPMHFVPWGAMNVSHPVAVLPMGGWVMRGEAHGTRFGRAAVVVGDPDFAGAYAQLPGARSEAEQVAALYGAAPLIGKGADEASVREQSRDGTRILHLATHGFFFADRPMMSGVVLSGSQRPKVLTAAELITRPLPARLVVLSACETGAGTAVAGDDFLGLVRSFYLGGTRAVVSSLWPVEDAGTEVFMRTFHEQAVGGEYGRAWIAARDKTLAMGLPPAVYGAFVLGGAVK